MRASVFVGAAVLLAACWGPAAPARPPAQALTGHLAEMAARSQAPGVVAAIYQDGALIDVYFWGGGDCGGHGAVDAFADFEIGSISKQMTAVGVLKLWEQHKLDINAPVGTYLSAIPEAWKRVTLRQLLTHTSGVPDYEEAGGYGVYETSPTPQHIFAIVAARPLDFEPGAQWGYSNTNYVLLSLVIERVSGRRFGDYMREAVFAPLHMQRTFESGYGPPGAAIAQGCKPGQGERAQRLAVRPISEASTYGAGGILSNVEDWARWDDALNGGRILAPASMQAMFTPVTLPDGVNTGYGMGMEVDDFRGEPRRGHSGQTQGFVADYASFPNRRLAFLILANQYGAHTAPLMQALELQQMPDLSYNRLPLGRAPDAQVTPNTRRALRQLILTERPLDLLSPDMQAFATGAEYADQRARLHDAVANMAKFEFVRSTQAPNNGPPRLLFRATDSRGAISYFTASNRNGKLYRLRWEEQ